MGVEDRMIINSIINLPYQEKNYLRSDTSGDAIGCIGDVTITTSGSAEKHFERINEEENRFAEVGATVKFMRVPPYAKMIMDDFGCPTGEVRIVSRIQFGIPGQCLESLN